MTLFLAGMALFIAGAVTAFVSRGRTSDTWYRVFVLGGCLLAAWSAALVLAGGASARLTVNAWVPGGRWVFVLDQLSAVLLIGISAIGAACVAFGTRYLASERGHRPVWFIHAVFAMVLAALSFVVVAQAIVPFLGAWEIMAVGSYLLIVVEHERSEVRRAGLIYLVATHTGTLALFGMFAIWGAQADDWSFASLAAASTKLPNGGATVLLLAGVGFGVKAGLVPFHFWLPPAHAAAPTHISALLSGIVIKTGIYGILRVMSMLGVVPAWWGWTVLALGIASGVLGVLWALAQHDLKRLLAYHSVENIGIILMGIGIGALGSAYGHPVVAVIGYAAALLHTINHALFKSLLFLGAGVVQRATGTRDMEALGGVGRALPYTWVCFLVGATAIIGVPPLNGFVSEWLVYQGLFRAGQGDGLIRLAVLGVPALALIGALALACFAKAAGVVFLGEPRSSTTIAAGVEREFVAPMAALAAACIVLGVAAPLGAASALRVAATLAAVPADEAAPAARLVTDAAWIGAAAVALGALIGAGWYAMRRSQRRRVVRTSETWACGYEAPNARMQYTASSFAAPLISAFGRMSGVRAQRTPRAFHTHPLDLVLDGVAMPLWAALRRLALRLRPMQQGRLYMYLIYVLAALLALLTYVAIEARRLT